MRMKIVVAAVALCIASQVPRGLDAQGPAAGTQPLVGTWQLSGLEQAAAVHYQLAAANPTAVGGSFMRNFELKGSEVTLLFPPTMLDGAQVRNTLTLKRLAGLGEMWPDFRR